jgi:VWFA-related protein
MTAMSETKRRWTVASVQVALAIVLMAGADARADGEAAGQTPAGLTIDVQVVDRDGLPMTTLGAEKFEVEVGGRKRRVLSAHVVQGKAVAPPDDAAGRQVYFVAIDALSFGPSASKAAVTATKAFIETLPPGSLVGLVTFPQGPAVELTSDRAALIAALEGLSGQQPLQRSSAFGLGPADVIEYVAASDRTSIVSTHCPAEDTNGCGQLLDQDVNAALNTMEAQVRGSLGMLADFTSRLARIPGRKVLVLVSAGLAVADRSGGRPDAGNLTTTAAESATRSNVTVYALLLDRVAESDRGQQTTMMRQAPNPARDRSLLARWLEQFSTAMGGALVKAEATQSGDAVARIARETASHYLLTVESTAADRGERPQRLRVRVSERGTTVRSRVLVAGSLGGQ